MTFRSIILAAAGTGALLALSSAAVAQTAAPAAAPAQAKTGENFAKDASPTEGGIVQQLLLADELAAYGRTNKDALALVVAAQIKKQIPVKEVDRKPEGDSGSGAAKAPDNDSVDALLKEAKDVSKGDKTIVALADDVKASATKGRTSGASVSVGQITGRTDHVMRWNFNGGRFAEAALVGLTSNLFALEIRDENGNLICRNIAPAYCSWNPIWTGTFVVRVKNLGGSLAHYKLSTN